MSTGHLLVNFGTVEQASESCTATANQLNGTLDDLRSYLAPLKSQWDGDAAGSYDALQAKWDQACAGLNAVLAQIGTAVLTAHDNYRSAETTNSSIWAV